MGHTLGLPHCDHTPTCLMNDARGTIRQIDREEPALCPVCLGRVGFVKTIRRGHTPQGFSKHLGRQPIENQQENRKWFAG
jgi:hypothetical protein